MWKANIRKMLNKDVQEPCNLSYHASKHSLTGKFVVRTEDLRCEFLLMRARVLHYCLFKIKLTLLLLHSLILYSLNLLLLKVMCFFSNRIEGVRRKKAQEKKFMGKKG